MPCSNKIPPEVKEIRHSSVGSNKSLRLLDRFQLPRATLVTLRDRSARLSDCSYVCIRNFYLMNFISVTLKFGPSSEVRSSEPLRNRPLTETEPAN